MNYSTTLNIDETTGVFTSTSTSTSDYLTSIIPELSTTTTTTDYLTSVSPELSVTTKMEKVNNDLMLQPSMTLSFILAYVTYRLFD